LRTCRFKLPSIREIMISNTQFEEERANSIIIILSRLELHVSNCHNMLLQRSYIIRKLLKLYYARSPTCDTHTERERKISDPWKRNSAVSNILYYILFMYRYLVISYYMDIRSRKQSFVFVEHEYVSSSDEECPGGDMALF